MNDDRKEIEKIQQRLEKLSQKQLELSMAHQQQFFFYRWLQGLDPELQSVKDEIIRLDRREQDIYKILQNAASFPPPVPEVDYSKFPFYSHTLKSWSFDSPFDQVGLYVTSLTSIGIVSRALWRSYHIKKAAELLEKGVKSELLSVHRRFSGLNDAELKDEVILRRFLKMKAFAVAGIITGGFTAFVQLKNRNRFNK